MKVCLPVKFQLCTSINVFGRRSDNPYSKANKGRNQAILHYDNNLVPSGGFILSTPEGKTDKIADFAVNKYNEYYVIYALKH